MNWGKPDDLTHVSQADKEAIWARILAETKGEGLIKWPFEGPAGFDIQTVKRYCVDTSYTEVAEWQKIRLSMKGVPTHEKLAILLAWWNKNTVEGITSRSCYVQVYNYAGALRRGGQLDENNKVRKYK